MVHEQITSEWLHNLGFEKWCLHDHYWWHEDLQLEIWEFDFIPEWSDNPFIIHKGIYFWTETRKIEMRTREAIEALIKWLQITKTLF